MQCLLEIEFKKVFICYNIKGNNSLKNRHSCSWGVDCDAYIYFSKDQYTKRLTKHCKACGVAYFLACAGVGTLSPLSHDERFGESALPPCFLQTAAQVAPGA